MKKYPRLYSLCTLGIRQHQEFDYQFHGFRTDFVGDSGCGKSMIADLLQMVFVGSEAFASGTDSTENREVDGMVLRTAGGRGTDIAYVLLNIELNPKQYVVLGAYLESSSRQSRSFIIQSDWDESSIGTINRPLSVSDIYVNDQIPTLEWFKGSLEEKGLAYHGYAQRRKFHAYLYKHQILSLDLSQSNQVLRDYAMIIQSFSRGKGLDIGDSSSLKRFLFGNEKAKEITDKYKKAVEELQLTLKEHAQNRDEIEKVTLKYQAIKSLKELKDRFDTDQLDYLIKKCAFTGQMQKEGLDNFKESSKDFVEAGENLQAMREILRLELLSVGPNTENFNREEITAKETYLKTAGSHAALLPFKKLLEEYDCQADQLLEIYSRYQEDKYNYTLIFSVQQGLEKNKLSSLLETYIHLEELSSILDAIAIDMAGKESQYQQKQQLLDFSELNNEGSLGYWAIQNYQAHSLEVESLLMFFKELPIVHAQNTFDQFIPNPTSLLKVNSQLHKTEGGFWIALGEVNQFIPYVKKQLFAAQDISALKLLLEGMSKDLQGEMKILKSETATLKSLRQFIISTSSFKDYLSVHTLWSALSDFDMIPALDITRPAFETGMLMLQDAEEIQDAFHNAETNWKEKQATLQDYDRLVKNLKINQSQLDNLLLGSIRQNILEDIINIFPEFKSDNTSLESQLVYLKSRFEKSSSKDAWVAEQIDNNKHKLKLLDINKQQESYQQQQQACEDAFKEARFILAHEPDISLYQDIYLNEPKEEEKKYAVSKSVYENKFDETVAAYAPSENYRFITAKNYLELCTAVLPDAFLEGNIDKDTSIDVIWDYLSKINDKNKSLNNRKLLKIRDILDEVADEVSKREDTVRQIHNFLDNGAREITGGHRAYLKPNYQNCYPKGWINDYIEKLSQENTLFATGQTLAELLNDSVSLEEKMINAFHAFGGHKGTKPKVEDLLNPNSYFDLIFKMESQSSGKTNIGSTGQVYAAIALLCIARLSLVNKSSFTKNPPPGIRFMPIDEVEGLGSNFDLLHDIARDFDYQIITMGIKPFGKFIDGEQYIYMLSNNKDATEDVNFQPYAIFCDADQNF
jgi:hypothetical protein